MISRETLLKMQKTLTHVVTTKQASCEYLCFLLENDEVQYRTPITAMLGGEISVGSFLYYRGRTQLGNFSVTANIFRLLWVNKMLEGKSIEDGFHAAMEEFKGINHD